jgi:TonB family protein
MQVVKDLRFAANTGSMPRSFLFAVVTLGLVLVPTRGLAQAEVVPPRLLTDPGVRYPEQALAEGFRESVEIVMVLVIGRDGSVEQVTVQNPTGHGFDEEATRAAKLVRFEPARRGDETIRARVEFRYRFEPPPEPLVEPEVPVTTPKPKAPTASPSPVAPPPPSPPVDEITVQGEKPAPAVMTYTRGEVRQIPGAFGDPFRAIETLPGVAPMASGLPFFYVRGAPPGNVGYFLDGIRVPFLYHVGIGPSVIHPAIVERVDLYSGGYPARYGRFAGGIVAAETTEPHAELHGEANLRLFDAGALVETGFAEGRGTVLVGGRYSYTATLLSLVAPEVKLEYRDYQARVSYDVTPAHRLSIVSFGSYDLLGEKENDSLRILFGSEFYRVDLRHDYRFAAGSSRTALTLGFDISRNDFLAGEQRKLTTRSLGVRHETRVRLAREVLLRAGGDAVVDDYQVSKPRYSDPDSPDAREFTQQFPPRSDLTFGLWSDVVLEVARGVEVTPGMRVDVFRSGSASAVGLDPRIAARFAVSDSVRILHAYGLVHQPPSFALPIPGLSPGELQGGLQTSFQTSAGVEMDVADATTASVTFFHNAFFDMTDALGASREGDGPPEFEHRSNGRSYGAEVFLRRRLTKKLGGFVSYTLSRSERSVGNEEFPSSFDRTHVLNAALGYDLGRGWRPGARGVFYTGTPVQPAATGAIPPPRTNDVERTKPFYRLDVRLEKRWQLGGPRWISFVVEVLNATLSKEKFGDSEIGPIVIPSIGAEAGF